MMDFIGMCIAERRDLNQLNDKGASFVSTGKDGRGVIVITCPAKIKSFNVSRG